jgi:hypothetical protein
VPDADASLRRALNERVAPPIRIASGAANAADTTRAVLSDVGAIERRIDGGSIVFVANTSNEPRDLRVSIAGAANGRVEEWDAVSGAAHPAESDERGAVRMALAPYESRLLVTTHDRPAGRRGSPARRSQPSADRGRLLDRWRVAVGGYTIQMGLLGDPDRMQGWDEQPHTRYFSGVGTYETSFAAGPTFRPGASRVWLDFGEGARVSSARAGERASNNGFRAMLDPPIREAAVIEVNGQRVGSLWTPPYRVEITSAVRAGENLLRVMVGNTAMNHMAGQARPDYRLLNLRYGERFVAQDMEAVQPLPSGLTAPVRVRVEP